MYSFKCPEKKSVIELKPGTIADFFKPCTVADFFKSCTGANVYKMFAIACV